MNFRPDNLTQNQEGISVLDKMVLEQSHLEQLPSIENMLTDIEKAVLVGKSEGAELIRELNLVGRIKEANGRVLMLDKNAVLGFLHSLLYGLKEGHPAYSDIEKSIKSFNERLGDNNSKNKRTRILVESSGIIERNNFTRAQVLSILSHEILHDISKSINVTWLNEGITERLNQGIIGDIILNSKEWDEVFANLNDEEDEEIRLSVYQEERSGLVELSERIRDDCSSYKNLPNTNYKELSKSESFVFKENFGKAYFDGDITTFDNNLKELGYSSIQELEALNPNT